LLFLNKRREHTLSVELELRSLKFEMFK